MRVQSSESRVQGFRDLKVWQRGRALVKEVYALTKAFPRDEVYGLTSQIRRSAVSIPSNIAEGSSKRSTREFIRFLNIAYGSLAELETQIQLAEDLDYIAARQHMHAYAEIGEIGRMLNALINKLEDKLNSELCTLDS